MQISHASEQGERAHQEDRFVVIEEQNGALLAIMDGHMGSGAVDLVAKNMPDIFGPLRKRFGAPKAIVSTCKKLAALTRTEGAGTTLSLVWISRRPRRIHVGVLGDSPVIIQRPGEKRWVSPEHNVRTNAKDRKAAVRRGGVCIEGYLYAPHAGSGLQLTRALGDSELASVLSREPEVFSFPLTSGSVIILASDGVLDPGHTDQPNQTSRLLAMIEKGGDAKTLVQDALERRTEDNATAIVCRV